MYFYMLLIFVFIHKFYKNNCKKTYICDIKKKEIRGEKMIKAYAKSDVGKIREKKNRRLL